MAHAESRRGRRARPLGLGKLETGARPFRAGRSSCGRCSIRRRPAPGCLPCSLGSWVAIMPPPPAPSTPPPWGLSPRGVLHRCSNVPPCSRNVPALWNTVSPLPLLAEPPLSYPLFQINRNRYRERRGGSATAALLVLGVYVSGGRNAPRFIPQLAAPPQLAMFQRLRNRRRNTASAIRRGRVHRRSEPHEESRPRSWSSREL